MNKNDNLYSLLRDYTKTQEEYDSILKALNLMKNFVQELGHFPEKEKQSEMDKKRLLLKELVWSREKSGGQRRRYPSAYLKRKAVTVKQHRREPKQKFCQTTTRNGCLTVISI